MMSSMVELLIFVPPQTASTTTRFVSLGRSGGFTDFLTLGYTNYKNQVFPPDFTYPQLHYLGMMLIFTIVYLFVAGLLVVLTIPALYEKYEDDIDRYILMGCRELQQLCMNLMQSISVGSKVDFQLREAETKLTLLFSFVVCLLLS
ncbi:hypothetical protein RHSIM_Rhsim09G0147500 [Rhododendron simsii]|uniref:Reticulon domain-containing protein n=1 Tax=Rhododendron simsii TaxID=118357 RepID=A0A834GEA8_RHOSS|nr:hypothetical protein RHSIM_Rhsim09G0147500 [Rhododendron simsii]